MPSVAAIVVTYRPDPALLQRLLVAVAAQVGAVVVVANEHASARPLWDEGMAATLLAQSENIGLAAAQNVGITWARERGFEHVLLLDQDSEPSPDMVACLLQALLKATGDGTKVAAVGPRFHDLREDRDAPFVRIGFPFNRKLWCTPEQPLIESDFLISSGSLIPMTVLDAIGDMDAGLFIDNVDMEWSFRARARGYTLLGVCAATMHHRLGDERHALPLGLGAIVVHGPVRLYYIMRNRVQLYRLTHTPRIWVYQDMPRVLVKLLLFAVLVGPRGRNLRFMLRGLWDGWRGRRGACPLR